MSLSDKLIAVAENIPKVYQAGKNSMIDESKIIQKQASGNPILINDVSEIPHEVTLFAQQGTKVNVYGKNLLDVDSIDFTIQGVSLRGGNGYLYLNGTSSGEISSKYSNWQNCLSFIVPKGKYTFTVFDKDLLSSGFTIYIRDENNTTLAQLTASVPSKTFALTEDTRVCLSMYIYKQTFSDTCIKLQLEYGNEATDFEPCKTTQYTVLTDDGIKLPSISPCMLFVSDNASEILVNYNKSYGMDKEWSRFIHSYLGGSRNSYIYCFAGVGWLDDILEKIDIALDGNGNTANYNYMFYYNVVMTKTPLLDFGNASSTNNMFYQATKLKEIYFTGEIHTTLSIAHSPLSKECIERIINGLSDTTSGLTVTFNASAVDSAFSTAEWNALIGTKQNWTISKG